MHPVGDSRASDEIPDCILEETVLGFGQGPEVEEEVTSLKPGYDGRVTDPERAGTGRFRHTGSREGRTDPDDGRGKRLQGRTSASDERRRLDHVGIQPEG